MAGAVRLVASVSSKSATVSSDRAPRRCTAALHTNRCTAGAAPAPAMLASRAFSCCAEVVSDGAAHWCSSLISHCRVYAQRQPAGVAQRSTPMTVYPSAWEAVRRTQRSLALLCLCSDHAP